MPRSNFWYLPGIMLSLAISEAGCSTIDWIPESGGSAAVSSDHVRLTYQTDSGRLNRAAGTMQTAMRPATEASSFVATVPPYSVSTVDIRYPHPDGKADLALVTVMFEAGMERDTSGFDVSSLWERVTGPASEDFSNSIPPLREQWVMEVPKWQLDSQIERLKKAGFFRREKTLSPKAMVAVETDGRRFGKKYHDLPELDAIILRVRQEGRLVSCVGVADQYVAAQATSFDGHSMRRLPAATPQPY